ncbi:MAG: hypothetical protein JRF47_04085 [Deltaproteobacteria bacterium]|nr:hypothetical protein [Deltaproteobacteria bacterium]
MKKSVNFALILVLVLYVAGCAAITPRTADLQNVHQLYRQEFLSSAIPQSPNDQKDIACQPNDEAFAQTLRAIRDYQVKYPQADSRLTQHLYVLQAMIYLQSGRPGMARLMQKEFIKTNEIVKRGNEQYPRDALFAANLEALVDGWMVYCVLDKAGGPFQDPQFTTQEQTLQTAAGEIQTNLESFETTDPAADEGALYLSASAAIFQMWASKIKGDRCFFGKNCTAIGLSKEDLENACGDDNQCRKKKRLIAIEQMKTKDLAAYHKLLSRFLSETEKRAAEAGELPEVPAGRWRYLALYDSLGQ